MEYAGACRIEQKAERKAGHWMVLPAAALSGSLTNRFANQVRDRRRLNSPYTRCYMLLAAAGRRVIAADGRKPHQGTLKA